MKITDNLYQNSFIRLCIVVFIVFGVVSCTQTELPDSSVYGYDYYPLKATDTLFYKVRRIEHNTLIPDDTVQYYTMRISADTIETVNGEDKLDYFYYRFDPDEELWLADSVVRAYKSLSQVRELRNSIQTKPLIFPLKRDLIWEGNLYNSHAPMLYELVGINVDTTIDKSQFSDVVLILQNNESSIVHKDLREEVYQKGVGLVYRKNEVYKYIADQFLEDGVTENPVYGIDSVISGVYYEQIYQPEVTIKFFQ